MLNKIISSGLVAALLAISPVMASANPHGGEEMHQQMNFSHEQRGGQVRSVPTYERREYAPAAHRDYHTGHVYENHSWTVNNHVNIYNGNRWHHNWNWSVWNGYNGFWFSYNSTNVFVVPTDDDFSECNYWNGHEWVLLVDQYGNAFCPE